MHGILKVPMVDKKIGTEDRIMLKSTRAEKGRQETGCRRKEEGDI